MLAADGKLYGTTAGGGSTSGPAGFAVVYKIDPTDWAVAIVYTFGNGRDGAYPTGA